MSEAVNYETLASDMRARWLEEKNIIDRAVSGQIKRPPEQIDRYKQVGRSIYLAGAEIAFIAKHAESYRAWKASVEAAK